MLHSLWNFSSLTKDWTQATTGRVEFQPLDCQGIPSLLTKPAIYQSEVVCLLLPLASPCLLCLGVNLWTNNCLFVTFLLLFFILFYFIFKLYKIVLVLPNIKMNPPQVYMSLAEGVLYYLMMYYRELVFYEAMATFSISLFHFSLLRPFTFLPLHLSFYPLPYFFPSFLCGNMGLNWAK